MSTGQSGQGFLRMDKAPLVDSEVAKHWQKFHDPSLITVTHTPNALTTHLVASESEEAPTVRMEQGKVVTKVKTADYGVIISVVGGPAVVEVALHADQAQRQAYLAAVAAVDAETAEHAATALREVALAFMQTVGIAGADQGATDDPQGEGESA